MKYQEWVVMPGFCRQEKSIRDKQQYNHTIAVAVIYCCTPVLHILCARVIWKENL